MDPGTRDFLERACSVCQRYDSGSGHLPFDAWPLILEDLDVDDRSQECRLLMEHLSSANTDGYFSYRPLLDALGPALPPGHGNVSRPDPDMREPAWEQNYSDAYRADGAGTDCGPRRMTSPSAAEHSYQDNMRHCDQMPPDHGGPIEGVMESYGSKSFNAQGDALSGQGDFRPGQSVEAPLYLSPQNLNAVAVEEVNEAFWARRGSSIQELYQRWDCNELSNDALISRLQELLGEAVDVKSQDSEFRKLTDKHRSARNLKFASMMSALRRDVRRTNAKRGILPSHTGLTVYAGSCASDFAHSDCGTDIVQPAGRPSDFASIHPSDSASMSGAKSRQDCASDYNSRVVADRSSRLSGIREDRQQILQNGSVADSRAQMCGSPVRPPSSSTRPDFQRREQFHLDVAGADGESSVHDELSARNRIGHGNILTWESRPGAMAAEPRQSSKAIMHNREAQKSQNPITHQTHRAWGAQ